jgi:hypothetical protein
MAPNSAVPFTPLGEGHAADEEVAAAEHDDRRDDQSDEQRVVHAVLVLGPHEEGADDRGHDAQTGDGQRQHDHAAHELLTGVEERAQDHRGDHRADVALEEVGAHAGHVADVVADVVGDGRRVARVVLGDARLDLADQVGADVGRLGVDAATDAREERDRAGAEREAEHLLEWLLARRRPAYRS